MKKLIVSFVLATLFLSIVSIGIASSVKNKASIPEIETITFVDYREPTHAGPGPHPTDCSGNFKFTNGGLKWLETTVTYDIDESTIPSELSSSDVSTAIANSFDAWKSAESASPTFSEDTSTNTISWQSLGTGGIVAYASISYYPATKEIAAFNMVFNSDLDWSTSGEAGKFDVFNVATHEAGHVEGLNHVNAPQDGLESMYKLTDEGETIKQTLCTGDISGIQALY